MLFSSQISELTAEEEMRKAFAVFDLVCFFKVNTLMAFTLLTGWKRDRVQVWAEVRHAQPGGAGHNRGVPVSGWGEYKNIDSAQSCLLFSQEADIDGDGHINYEEFYFYMNSGANMRDAK